MLQEQTGEHGSCSVTLMATPPGEEAQHSPAALICAALLHNRLPVEEGFQVFDQVEPIAATHLALYLRDLMFTLH